MPLFENRGTKPGFTQVNSNLWRFLVVCTCVSVAVAVFFATRGPLQNSIEKRTISMLMYQNPKCKSHVVDSITFKRDGSSLVTAVSCGVTDSFVLRGDDLEYAPGSPNFGKPLMSTKVK
jgi:hypothetical protein